MQNEQSSFCYRVNLSLSHTVSVVIVSKKYHTWVVEGWSLSIKEHPPPPMPYLLSWVEFITRRLRSPQKGMPTRRNIFSSQHAWVSICARLLTIKRLCHVDFEESRLNSLFHSNFSLSYLIDISVWYITYLNNVDYLTDTFRSHCRFPIFACPHDKPEIALDHLFETLESTCYLSSNFSARFYQN